MKRVFRILFIAICIAVMLFSGYQIYRELAVYEEGDSAYEALETYFHRTDQPQRRRCPGAGNGGGQRKRFSGGGL